MNELIHHFRWPLSFFLIGLILIGLGILYSHAPLFQSRSTLEIINDNSQDQTEIIIEVGGAVENPGVYHLSPNARIQDALDAANGLSDDADLDWVSKTLNRASLLTDGQKIYIPNLNEHSDSVSANISGGISSTSSTLGESTTQLVNINTASAKELESLWGIGPVTAQNIIEQRPYSNVEELLVKKILKSNVYERNKDQLTIY